MKEANSSESCGGCERVGTQRAEGPGWVELEKGLGGLSGGHPVLMGRVCGQQSQVRGSRMRNSGCKHKWVLYRTECEGKVLSCEEVQRWSRGSETDGISCVEGFKT